MSTTTAPFVGIVRLMGIAVSQEMSAWDRYMDVADVAPYEEEEVAKVLWRIADDTLTDLFERWEAASATIATAEQARARRAAARKVTPKMAALRSNPRLLVMAAH